MDGHLSLKHSKVEVMLIIGANNKNLNDAEKSEIIKRKLNIYVKKEEKLNFQKLNHQVKLYYWNQEGTVINA